MKRLFKRHRVRATFYHIISVLYLILALYVLFSVGGDAIFWIGALLFLIDYIAEMYDPHPDAPGPLFGKNPVGWAKSHFHRFLDDEEDD